MTSNFRCLVCDAAWAMEKSEQGFYKEFNSHERAQLIATYRSQMHRSAVQGAFPLKQR